MAKQRLLTVLPKRRPKPTAEELKQQRVMNMPVGDVLEGTVIVAEQENGIAYIQYRADGQSAAVSRKHVGDEAFSRLRHGLKVRFRVNVSNVVVSLEDDA